MGNNFDLWKKDSKFAENKPMAVFGSIYCPISRLSIHDGDSALLVPLKFCLNIKAEGNVGFGLYDIAAPYQIIEQPQEIIYGGCYNDYEYCETSKYFKRERFHNLYMILHKDFYYELTDIAKDWFDENCRVGDGLFMEEIAKKDKEEHEENMFFGMLSEKYPEIKPSIKYQTPLWMLRLKVLCNYMYRLCIIPYPNVGIDQCFEEYDRWEEIREKYLQKQKRREDK